MLLLHGLPSVFQAIERAPLLEVDRPDIFQHSPHFYGLGWIVGAVGIWNWRSPEL